MKLELGKKYITRADSIVGPLEENKDNKLYPFIDVKSGLTWQEDGQYDSSILKDDRDILYSYRNHTPTNPKEPINTDPVNYPKHYMSHPSGVECIEITRHMDFNVGNAIKYLWRAGLKEDNKKKEIEDLRKAMWYIEDKVTQLENEL